MEAFEYRVTPAGTLLVRRGGRIVLTLSGTRAARAVARLGHDDAQDQQVLARLTGPDRRGGARTGGRDPRRP